MQSSADCPAASEFMQLRGNLHVIDPRLSFIGVACLPLWRNRYTPRTALSTARPIDHLDRICKRANYSRWCRRARENQINDRYVGTFHIGYRSGRQLCTGTGTRAAGNVWHRD